MLAQRRRRADNYEPPRAPDQPAFQVNERSRKRFAGGDVEKQGAAQEICSWALNPKGQAIFGSNGALIGLRQRNTHHAYIRARKQPAALNLGHTAVER